ncbi:BTAD domain-containing putative transcriptional regulator [Streptomyces graminilatus]|uniref:BTAD domain-containing putative transcriptional regulator n=1 Tax=Streptomyces graminilatus TaxID=1464070 RepID=UPI0006E15CA6|nr:BTAD domain-containing putative transcriptional regulator [Streptomyces graminilatus]
MIAPDGGPGPGRADGHGPGAAVESTLRIAVLGRLAATSQGRDLNLGGPRQRAVFARLLAARGNVVTGDQLADSLWGDAPPPGATRTLRVYVSRLRREFESDRVARDRRGVIVSEGSGYAVRISETAVDAWRFEQLLNHAAKLTESAAAAAVLSGALVLWHGPAFAGFADEPWARTEADRLGGLREVARERLLAARLECGDSAAVVPEAEALVAEEPLREERWRLLVLSLYRSHRQADALAALRHARRTLADELGIDPGPALRLLESEVLAQSPRLDTPTPAPPHPPSGNLVDRDREVTVLRGCLADVLAGRAGIVCLEGPAGIGRSRLLAETRRLAAGQGILTLAAHGSRLEKDYGFGVVRQLLDPVVAGHDSELPAGTVAAAATVLDGQEAPGASRPENFAVLHSLYLLIVRLTEDQPLVIAVDDLQWCDTGSLRFLAYLAPRVKGLPVLIATTLRTGEPHDDQQLLADLAGDPLTTHIRPRPLSPEGVAALVRHRLGEPADDLFVAACHRTTAGNPLLLRQLLGALASAGVRPDAAAADTVASVGSRAVSSMVLVRLAQLPDAATAVAQAVAVLGDGASLPVVAACTELSEQAVAAATALLVRVEVLRDEYPLGFVHPLVADAVHRNVQAGELQLRHERAARVLHAAGAVPERIAAHLLLVPHRGEPWAVEVLRAAAAGAAARGAADVATTYLTRALLEPPGPDVRPEVLLELGRAEAAARA